MSTENKTITILSIDAVPEKDPYSGISGHLSRTVLVLDLEDCTIRVEQDYPRSNSTTFRRFHGIDRVIQFYSHPVESDIREWIEENMDLFERVCAGATVEWDGSNHIGVLDDDASSAWLELERTEEDLGYNMNCYEVWQMEEWVSSMLPDIKASTSDEELRQMASNAIEALAPYQMLIEDEDDIYRYFAGRRDDLQAEEEEGD